MPTLRDAFRLTLERVAPDTLLAVCAGFWFDTHNGVLHRLAVRRFPRSSVDDLVQVVWVAVLKRLDDFGSAGVNGQRAWLARKVRDAAADHFRKLRIHREEPFADAAPPLAHEPEPPEEFELHWKCAAVRAVIADVSAQLSTKTATIVRLHWLEEKSHAEIAAELGLTEHQVRDRNHEAMKKLKKRFEQLYGPGAERL